MILSSQEISRSIGVDSDTVMQTKRIVIEPGALLRLERELYDCGLVGRSVLICDSNTKPILDRYALSFDEVIQLPEHNLHADEIATERVLRQITEKDLLIAFGTGTIHDITRFCAHKKALPFISCPTAASVDGFSSAVSAMTWKGYKKTMPGVAPALVVADLEIVANAPIRLTASGVGDLLGKHISLADWEIAASISNEPYSGAIAAIMRQAVNAMQESLGGLLAKRYESYEKLMYGLVLSGLVMQVWGNSRPASGAEHHVSHMIEMNVLGNNTNLHGEKVGVTSILVSRVYHDLANMSRHQLKGKVLPYMMPQPAEIEQVFGNLSEDIIHENTRCCAPVDVAETLVQRWDEVRLIISRIPESNELRDMLETVGAKTDLLDIDLHLEQLQLLLNYSPLVRNRLTLMRVAVGCSLI
jgi:glycerol-1-phosphate dehydrogenase [NAD(P)+]